MIFLSPGHVIEFGCGAYTQLRHILETAGNVTVESVTLIDPLLDSYKTIPMCAYGTGKFVVNEQMYDNTTLIVNTTESFFKMDPFGGHQWDTVIVMNVLLFSYDALQ